MAAFFCSVFSHLCFTSKPVIMGFLIFIFLIGMNGAPTADSSTLGVGYISRLLEIHDRERAPPSVQVAAAYTALNRLIPSHSSSFQFSIISKARYYSSLCFSCLIPTLINLFLSTFYDFSCSRVVLILS